MNVAPEHQARARAGETMDEEWAVLDEMEGRGGRGRGKSGRPKWLPHNMEPILEELPKWGVLADVLKEIDETIIANSMQHCKSNSFHRFSSRALKSYLASTRNKYYPHHGLR